MISEDANIYAKCNYMLLKNEHRVHSPAAEHILEVEDIHDFMGSSHWRSIPLQYNKLVH